MAIDTISRALSGQASTAAKQAKETADSAVEQAISAVPGAVSDWLEDNVTPTTPVVDASLSISGAAADAKATGDEITDLKSALSYQNYASPLLAKNDYAEGDLICIKFPTYTSLYEATTDIAKNSALSSSTNIRNISSSGDLLNQAYHFLDEKTNILSKKIAYLPNELFYPENIIKDVYLNSSGDFADQSGWCVTNFLRITKLAEYYLKTAVTSSAVYSWFYDKDYNKLSGFQTATSGTNTLVAPQNAYFVRFSVQADDINDFTYKSNLEKTATNYIVPGNFKDGLYVGFVTVDVGVQASENWATSPFYQVRTGDIFYLSHPAHSYLVMYDSTKTFVGYGTAYGNDPVTLVIPVGVSYIKVNILKSNISSAICTINGEMIGIKRIYESLYSPNTIWAGKSYISHGDSITWQDGKAYIQGEHIGEIAKGYQTIFANNTNVGSIDNRGQSGRSMAKVNGNGIVDTILNVAYYKKFDLCTIACGTNDFKLNVPLGTLGVIGDTTFDDTTFYGAYRKSVEYILNNSPTIRLVLMTPLQRDNSGYDVNYINSAGHKLIDYANAIKNIGQMYSLPVCDMYSNSGFTKKTLPIYTMDGLHPNDVGYKRMGNYLTAFLESIGI